MLEMEFSCEPLDDSNEVKKLCLDRPRSENDWTDQECSRATPKPPTDETIGLS